MRITPTKSFIFLLFLVTSATIASPSGPPPPGVPPPPGLGFDNNAYLLFAALLYIMYYSFRIEKKI